jgi:hypothetical protein
MRSIHWLVVGTAVVAGCGGDGGRKPTAPETHEPVPLQIDLVASAQDVAPGDAVELTWTVQGEGPITVTLGGEDVSDRSLARVHPLATTEYVVVAWDAYGEARDRVTVTVIPRLEPRVSSVPPGGQQRFWVAGAEGPFEWSVDGGSIESGEYGPALWTAPATLGTYELRVAVPGHPDVVQRIDVREERTVERRLEGVFGQPDPRETEDVVAAPDGTLWAVATSGLVLRRAPGPTARWTIASQGLEFSPWTVAVAPEGTAWAVGWTPDGTGVLGRRDVGSRSWVREPGPWDGGRPLHFLAAGAAGAVAVGDNAGEVWVRPSADAPWSSLPRCGGLVKLHFAGDGLYARRGSEWGREDYVRVAADGSAWEPLVQPPEGSGLGSDPAGSIVAWGDGVFRLRADGSWEELSDGLPSGSPGLGYVQDVVFANDRCLR